jgi:hypothetical protein
MTIALADDAAERPPLLFGDRQSRDALTSRAEGFVGRTLVMMNRAQALVAADRCECIDLLNARRAALCVHLQRYQRFKHGSIFDPVVRFGFPSSKIIARAMKVDCLTLGEEFAAYHTRWLRLRSSEWQRYREDMLATVDNLSVHLDGELRAMRQLIMISAFYDD